MKSQEKYFTSRLSILIAMIGMAVGTGNLWRFPRIIAQYGGAVFILPFLLFLLTWALPLLIVEFGLGRGLRMGPSGSFRSLSKRYGVLGIFVALCTMGLMFYYAVIAGWCLKYVIGSFSSSLYNDPQAYWTTFIQQHWQVSLFHLLVLAFALGVVYKGVSGIQRANKIFVPLLFILLIILVWRVSFLPNSDMGFKFLFKPDFRLLLKVSTWIQALAQVAWSTGAGTGLVMVYSIYMRRDHDIMGTAVGTCLGDASASILAAAAILPTIFANLGSIGAKSALQEGNFGLMFIWIPRLLQHTPLSRYVIFLFFLSLFFAALTSLIAMLELCVRTLQDFNIDRKRAIVIVAIIMIIGGLPSVLNNNFLQNQDWVWSIGLIFNGLFFAILVGRYGAEAFRQDFLNPLGTRFKIGRWLNPMVRYGIPVQFLLLIGWWSYQTVVSYPQSWWNPLKIGSLGTCFIQFALLFGIAIFLHRRFNN